MGKSINYSESTISQVLTSTLRKHSEMDVIDLFSTDGYKSTHSLCTVKLLMGGFVSFVPPFPRIEPSLVCL